MLSWFEMTAPTPRRRAQFSDADGNLVADTPSDTQSQLDPDRIVFSYVGGPAAEEERAAWTGFAEHLARATDKPVDLVAYSTTDQQLAAFSSGQLHVTGFNTGAVPLSVAAFGFVPICTHGTDEGAFGTTMQLIVPAKSVLREVDNIKGHTMALKKTPLLAQSASFLGCVTRMWRLPVNLRRQWLVRRLRGRARVAVLHASQQPQEVHAASTVRLPGAQELLEDRLSRCRREACEIIRGFEKVLHLNCVPHFTTLQKASRHLLTSGRWSLPESTIRLHYGRCQPIQSSAVDSTGLECTAASGYFVRRRQRVSLPWKTVVYHRYPKLGLVCDTSCHFILSIRVGRGPRPDVDELVPLLTDAVRSVLIDCLAADAGYDSESNHRFDGAVRCADLDSSQTRPPNGQTRQRTLPPAHANALRPRQVPPSRSGRGRDLDDQTSPGAHARGRSYQAQCRDLRLMALTHNVMILIRVEVFY